MSPPLWGLWDEVRTKLKLSQVKIENPVFQLFCKVTAGILFLSAGLVTLQSLIGEHIKCITPPKEDIRIEAVNQYCFIMSTYTLPHLYNKTVDTEVIAFAVGPHVRDEDEQKYHSYYQWVPFVLFFQGILFIVPHILWKMWEDGRIKAFSYLELTTSDQFRDRCLLGEDHESPKKTALKKAAECFRSYMYYNYFYSGYYVICEIMNFVIVILTIYATDAFLGYEFTTYGSEVVSFLSEDPENRIDPMDKVFPKVTKCDFRKIGPSGNIIHYDVLCVLALNILNEKIFVFLWFWYIILAIIGGLALLYRIAVCVSTNLRQRLILRRVPDELDSRSIRFLSRLNYSDWFLLKRISENTNTLRFGELCDAINRALESDDARDQSIHSESSPGSLMSPPPTYDSSTLPVKDDEKKNSSTELYSRNYPAFPLENLGREEEEPFVSSRL